MTPEFSMDEDDRAAALDLLKLSGANSGDFAGQAYGAGMKPADTDLFTWAGPEFMWTV